MNRNGYVEVGAPRPCGRVFHTVLVALLAIFVLVGCGDGQPEVTHANTKPLRIGWSSWPGYYPILIAYQQGLFLKHGVAVDPIYYDTYKAGLADYEAGRLDGNLNTLGDAVIVESHSPGNRVVLLVDTSAGGDAIVALPEIQSVADLKGKRLGVQIGTFGELLVTEMLKQNDLTLNDVSLVNLAPESMPDELGQGVDAGHAWEPLTSQLVGQGNRIVFSTLDTPGLVPDVLILRPQVISDRPSDVSAFLAAWFDALAWWQANPGPAAAFVAPAIGMRPADISSAGLQLTTLDDNLQAFRPGSDTSSLYFTAQLYVDFFIRKGDLTRAPVIEDLLDPSFLK